MLQFRKSGPFLAEKVYSIFQFNIFGEKRPLIADLISVKQKFSRALFILPYVNLQNLIRNF